MKKINHIFQFWIVSFLILAPLLSLFSISSSGPNEMLDAGIIDNDGIMNKLKTSDIAGSDLYAEQISAYVAGDKSIIRQSLFTNDTNIFSHFDSHDPAFYKCNILLSATNGINPAMFPSILTDNIFGSSFALSFNSFIGFLYYDEDLKPSDARSRATRGLDIIKRKFQIDLIMVNTSLPNFFPFVGYYPDWEVYFNEITQNLPMDGYWKALNLDRILHEYYLDNYHISTTFLLLNNLEFLDKDFNISTDQLNFNLNAVDFSFLQNADFDEIMGQIDDIMGDYADLYGNLTDFFGFASANETISSSDLDAIEEVMGNFALTNNSHYTSLIIQYEGDSDGIKEIDDNEYEFDLWRSMAFFEDELGPSEKIYIALIGAFMSEIDINILGTDIVDFDPDHFEFSEYMLEQIGLILFFADIDFDLDTIKDYSLELLWVNEDGIYRNYIRPVNLEDETDPVNSLAQLGFQGFPFIPTGILDPIEEFTVEYEVKNAEPNMIITKELVSANATYGAYREFQFNITAENVGNITVWGNPTPIPVDLESLFGIIAPGLGSLVYEAMFAMVNTMYPGYDSLEEFLNVDDDPRIFYFDTWGTGAIDHYYPDLLNTSNLFPYSKQMPNVIDQMQAILLALGMSMSDINDLKDSFTNEESIWNDDNWYLNPGEKISYLSPNFTIAGMDTFTSFLDTNFTIKDTFPELPALIYGNSVDNTNASMALKTDEESWIIEAEQRTIDRFETQVDFIFENSSNVDLENNTLESVNFLLNYSAPLNLDTLDLLVYNFSTSTYIDATPFISMINDGVTTFSFIKYNSTINWLFDPTEINNYKAKFRIHGIDNALFNISINDFNMSFADRDVNTMEILGSSVMFTGQSASIQFSRYSNSFTISTYDMASISASASLTHYNSRVGELNTYTLDFSNIGSDIAHNISIRVPLPGIIANSINFTVKNNYLLYNLTILAPSESRTVSFTFYTPNSESIAGYSMKYDNPRILNSGNSSQLRTGINQIYISSPVDYDTRFPYLRVVEIEYDSSDDHPEIDDIFTLDVEIENVGPKNIPIPDINLSMNDQFGNLMRIDNNILEITDIDYDETKSVSLRFKKKNWKGYYYAPINYLGGSESNTIQIAKSDSLILGEIEFDIDKEVNVTNVEIGKYIEVKIEIKNTGDICVKNISLNDIISFSQAEFSLFKGKLVNFIEKLKPGEKEKFEYIIQAKEQSSITMKGASVDYYYLLKEYEESNEIDIKVILPLEIQILFIMIPCILATSIIGIYYWQTRKYKAGKYETQRNEMDVFDLSSRDSILKIEHTLRERMNIIIKERMEKESKIIKKDPKKGGGIRKL